MMGKGRKGRERGKQSFGRMSGGGWWRDGRAALRQTKPRQTDTLTISTATAPIQIKANY